MRRSIERLIYWLCQEPGFLAIEALGQRNSLVVYEKNLIFSPHKIVCVLKHILKLIMVIRKKKRKKRISELESSHISPQTSVFLSFGKPPKRVKKSFFHTGVFSVMSKFCPVFLCSIFKALFSFVACLSLQFLFISLFFLGQLQFHTSIPHPHPLKSHPASIKDE